ncbi:MAG: hypothetical protein U9N87_14635, partial [Planctomycetota bacterium]|nr:hypothetical protein [Planctomycetota bacterium]
MVRRDLSKLLGFKFNGNFGRKTPAKFFEAFGVYESSDQAIAEAEIIQACRTSQLDRQEFITPCSR